MPTRVRPHARRLPRPVNRIILKRGSPKHKEWLERGMGEMDIFITPLNDVDETLINEARGVGPVTAAKVQAHEDVHKALHRIGEVDASFAIDTIPGETVYPERNGLYALRRQRP
jgi:hypothetical protein